MKAVVYEEYGGPDVLKMRDVPTPTPGDREILIRIRATTVTSADWRARSLELPAGFGFMGRLAFGVTKPRKPILGTELAGDVEAVGDGVRRFQVGDPVFACSGAGMGCHAEYRCMPEDGAVAPKPANLDYEQAAGLCFGGTTALDFFRRADLDRGENVLVNGASGGVGTAAVQLAKHFGARVTGVCSARNVDLVESLGADRVIDHTAEDFTRSGDRYDVIVDTAGNAPYSRSRHALAPDGRLLLVLGGLTDLLGAPWVSLTTDRKVIAGPASVRPEDVRRLGELAQAGAFVPVIDREYPFERIADAHRHVDTGRKRGNVVVTLSHDA